MSKPTLQEAFQTVIDLAEQNALDADDCDEEQIPIALLQEESIAVVKKFMIDTKKVSKND